MSSHPSHHPQEVILAQFSLYVHKSGLKPDSFHFLPVQQNWTHLFVATRIKKRSLQKFAIKLVLLLLSLEVVKEGKSDADTMFVSTPLSYSKKPPACWGARRKLVGPSSTYYLRDVPTNSAPVIRKNILFIHTRSGCNTKSAKSGHSKTKQVKVTLKN